eukprot:5254004-Amphidinium_carterae.1
MVDVHTIDFWRLPLPDLDESDSVVPQSAATPSTHDSCLPSKDDSSLGGMPGGCAGPVGMVSHEWALNVAETQETDEEVERPKPPRNMAAEMTEMLHQYRDVRGTFHAHLKDLKEMQARLEALTVQAAMQGTSEFSSSSRHTSAQPEVMPKKPLPPEIVDRVLWWLDVSSLTRAMCFSLEWSRLTRVPTRWQALGEADWGSRHGCTCWPDYRQRLDRWRGFLTTLAWYHGA